MSYLESLKKQGKSLVISGPEGSGKTLLAKQLAGDNHSVTTVRDIMSSAFQGWLSDSIDVVIVEESTAKRSRAEMYEMDKLIRSETIRCNRKYKKLEVVKTPFFIFTSINKHTLNIDSFEQRFAVI